MESVFVANVSIINILLKVFQCMYMYALFHQHGSRMHLPALVSPPAARSFKYLTHKLSKHNDEVIRENAKLKENKEKEKKTKNS